MRICLMVEGQEGVTWDAWLALARAAEDAGLDALFRSDHYRAILRGDGVGALDAWTLIAALAARTERIRLGTLVSPVTFRPAPLLAKAVATADHVSGGRVELGLGAGWYEPEHALYGIPFPPTRERMDELDRQLDVITRQWSDDDPLVLPKPVQRPRPPIIIGGTGKPRTVRAAVRHADEYNGVYPTVDEARALRATIDEAARAVGREPLRLSMMCDCVVARDAGELHERLGAWRSITGREHGLPVVSGTVDEVAAGLRAYADAGVERVMLQHLCHEDVDMVALLGELGRAIG